MKIIRVILLAFVFAPLFAHATDKECKIEGFRYYEVLEFMMIEGSTTCQSGQIYIRLYESSGDEEKYLGNATGFINGYTFELIANDIVPPEALSIKYTIK